MQRFPAGENNRRGERWVDFRRLEGERDWVGQIVMVLAILLLLLLVVVLFMNPRVLHDQWYSGITPGSLVFRKPHVVPEIQPHWLCARQMP